METYMYLQQVADALKLNCIQSNKYYKALKNNKPLIEYIIITSQTNRILPASL